jgi:hypothetical protein
VNMTDYGFDKEPKNLGLVVELSVQGFENQVMQLVLIPEFSSFLALLPIMFAALIVMFLQKRRVLYRPSKSPRRERGLL